LELPKERVVRRDYSGFLEWTTRIESKLGRIQGPDCFVVHKSLKKIPKLSKGIQDRVLNS